MDTYKECVIRCKSSNDQIACYAKTYEDLLSAGTSVEEALNLLGIMNPCCRIAMMNPTIVAFNMENREVIEGFKSVEAANEDDAQNESMSRPIFSRCMGTITPGLQPCVGTVVPISTTTTTTTTAPVVNVMAGIRLKPAQTTTPSRLGIQTSGRIQPTEINTMQTTTTMLSRSQQVAPINTMQTTTTIPSRSNIQTIGLSQPSVQTQPIQLFIQQPTSQIASPEIIPPTLAAPILIAPIIPGIGLEGEKVPIGLGIDVDKVVSSEFQEPTTVGIPTINHNPLIQNPTTYVGSVGNKAIRVEVLTGRTYLAQ